MMNKIYLSGITYGDAKQGIENNIIPIAEHFHGLNFTFNLKNNHFENNESELYKLLCFNKKDGFIHICKWNNNYAFSRNHYLLEPRVLEGDVLIVVDSLEKLNPNFCKSDMINLANMMYESHLDVIFLHGKTFMVRKNEGMVYQNAVHEQINPIRRAIELTQIKGFEDSSKYFENTRPKVREKDHWVSGSHFLKYYCYSPIQCLMGAEGNEQLYYSRIENRNIFKNICRRENIYFSVEDILNFWKTQKQLPKDMIDCINKEKILNDVYRFHILGEKDLTSDWNFENIKKI